MAREIKFRAWDEQNKRMVGAGFVIYPDGKTEFPESGWDLHGFDDKLLLMQYTGLKDKNGVDIYEGDVLHSDHQQLTARVVWETPGFALQAYDGSMGDFKVSDSYRNGKPCDYIEVIGNIFENPELLTIPVGKRS